MAFLTGLSGAAGLYLVRRSGDQVANLTGVVTPLRAENNRLIGTVHAMRRTLLGTVARLPGQEAEPL
ncbi:hypothetical protein [Paracraurococcus lichenis]|uniref:HAMP domain-containing protein n=1 Tax=Paracraurococcus lichenis TaxID=3064888 RepID=A0ABT9EE00_9PROT|nr:hypothetical protein [Paracraurococcus sp. LOR1-02]MDO9714457.1 hypothetical protein [Paracraurococcus sp. LOR1-02]